VTHVNADDRAPAIQAGDGPRVTTRFDDTGVAAHRPPSFPEPRLTQTLDDAAILDQITFVRVNIDTITWANGRAVNGNTERTHRFPPNG
jgi:hypothetical protein